MNPRPADYKSAALPTELHQHLNGLVGATGFEPAASWSQTKHSTKLSYAPLADGFPACIMKQLIYYNRFHCFCQANSSSLCKKVFHVFPEFSTAGFTKLWKTFITIRIFPLCFSKVHCLGGLITRINTRFFLFLFFSSRLLGKTLGKMGKPLYFTGILQYVISSAPGSGWGKHCPQGKHSMCPYAPGFAALLTVCVCSEPAGETLPAGETPHVPPRTRLAGLLTVCVYPWDSSPLPRMAQKQRRPP